MKLVIVPLPRISIPAQRPRRASWATCSSPCVRPSIAAVIIFGWRALLVTAVCAAACVFFEWGFEKLCRKPSTIDDLSAAVTGVILAYNLPVSIPLWQAVFGCLVAIVAVKQLFGGIGKNFANPALVGAHRAVPLVLQDHDGLGLPRRRLHRHAAGACWPPGRSRSYLDAAARQPRRLHRRDLRAGAAARRGVSAPPRRHHVADARVLRRDRVRPLRLILGQDAVAADPLGRSAAGRVLHGDRLCDRAADLLGPGAVRHRRGSADAASSASTAAYAEGVSFAILFMNILTPYLSKWTQKQTARRCAGMKEQRDRKIHRRAGGHLPAHVRRPWPW